MPGFIAAEMRRTTRDLLLVNGVLFVALAGAALASARYLHNFFAGPFATRIEQLDEVRKVDGLERRFVTVTGDRCFDTGWSETTYRRTKHGTVTTLHRFSLLVQGDRALVVHSSHGAVTRLACTGELVSLPDATRRGVEAVLRRAKAEPPRLLAVELDADDYRSTGFVALGVGVPLALLALSNLVRGVRRLGDPSRHPIVREIERYGEFVETATAIEVELAEGVKKIGPFRITKSWLLRSVIGQLDVVKLDDVLWAFLRRGRHPVLEIRSRRRPRLQAPSPSRKSQQVLDELAQRVTWVALGDDREWRTLWKQGVDAFAGAIDERRRKFAAEGASDSVPLPFDLPSEGGSEPSARAKGVSITLVER